MQPQHVKLCVVSPCFNEADGIQAFYKHLKAELDHLEELGVTHRIIFVDDGSQDGTLNELLEIRELDSSVTVLSFSRNFGHQVALTAGLDAADGDAIVLMDSDLQHPPEHISEMLAKYREGYDIVSMVRQSTAKASSFKRFTSNSFYYVLNLLSDTRIEPGAADFVLFSRQAHQAIQAMPERHRFLRGMVAWVGFKRTFIPFDAPPRAAGESKYALWRMLALAADAAFSFSTVPARLTTRAGLLFASAGALYFCYILFRHFWFADTVQGWSSLLSVILLLGGFQLVFMGMLAEYVVRIFEETKQRPLYVLRDLTHARSVAPDTTEWESHEQLS